jgi:hypothetical protein
MTHAILCIVPTQTEADRIVGILRETGLSNDKISVIMPDKTGNPEAKKAAAAPATKGMEQATSGAKAGLLIGGALGLLAGVGFIALPGAGVLIAAGPLMAAISGAALGGSAGGVAGGLIGLGMKEDVAKHYERMVQDGNVLLSVHTDNADEAVRVEEIFKNNGASDVKRTEKHVQVGKP